MVIVKMVRFFCALCFLLVVVATAKSHSAALREASASGNLDKVVALLAKGAGPNSPGTGTDDPGETPLHLACIGGDAEIVKALLASGAFPNARATGPRSLRMTPLTWYGCRRLKLTS